MDSAYSRPQKYVREVTGVPSLEEAERLRQQPFWLVVHEEASARAANLVRALMAIAVRSCTGKIHVRVVGSDEFQRKISAIAEAEAESYGCMSRIFISAYDGHEKLGNGITIGINLPEMIAVDASGMYAAINNILPVDAPAPHGAAACFAASTAFTKFFAGFVLGKNERITESWGFSLETFSVADPETLPLPGTDASHELGQIHLLGAGAIGSAFCYSIHLSNDFADISIVDRERYDEPNQETTFFLNQAEAACCPQKAEYLAKSATREGLVVNGLPMMEINAGDAYLNRSCNSFVCAVDNSETRRLLDDIHGDVLLNGGLGGTSSDAGHVLVTWHNSYVQPLSKLYPPSNSSTIDSSKTIPKEITDECSMLAYESVSLAAPFVALSSGALLHALCCLSARSRLPDANYFKFDLLNLQGRPSRKFLD